MTSYQAESRRRRWPRTAGAGPEFVSVTEAAERLRDGDIVSPGGFLFTRIPVQLLTAVADRRLRGLTYLQWGGGLALEILLEAGSIGHIVFCFSSLDIFGAAPRFRHALESGEVTFQELTALELHQSLMARAMNLESLPLQTPLGSWRAPADGSEITSAPFVPVDAVLIHASRADELGNLEIDGALGLDRLLAFAGGRVIATVEEVVPPGSLSERASVIPRQFVEAIAVTPGGAWPTSCLPFYAADYTEIAQRVESQRLGAASSSQVAAGARLVARTDWRTRAWPTPAAGQKVGAAEHMVVWLSRQLDDSSVCSVGAVSPLANIAYLVAKRTHAPRLTLITHGGGYVDVSARFMSLSFGEAMDYQSAAVFCGGDDSYRWLYQQGRVTHEVVGAAQIDQCGRTNNRWIRRSDGSRLRLPGQGGMADVANMHRNFILYAPRQSPRQLVDTVDEPSAARGVHDPEQRARLGYGPGGVQLVTDLGAFLLDPGSRRFRLTTLHPGIGAEDIRRATGWPVDATGAVSASPPSPPELAVLNAVDPFGLRELEFVSGGQRLALIKKIVALEQAYLAAA